MPDKRKKALIGGVEFETPADMPMEEIERRHRELTERGERARAESETLDVAAQQRAIAEDLTSDSTRPPEMIAFARALTDASEIAALHRLLADRLHATRRSRSCGGPPTSGSVSSSTTPNPAPTSRSRNVSATS